MDFRISIHRLYFKIAVEHQRQYEVHDSRLKHLETKGIVEEELSTIKDEMMDCYTNREQSAIIVVTFSAMCLEAFLYDYAAEKLGDKYVQEHLDKLDLKSKYVLYPRLISGKEIDKSAEAYSKTVELCQLRNIIVHFKSESFSLTKGKKIDFHSRLNEKLAKGVIDSVNAVRLVMKELDKLHGSNFYSEDLDWYA